LFMQRALNYKNVWNPETKYMHPREIDSSWMTNFEPVGSKEPYTRGFCESNSAIYTYFVPQDVNGLAELFGGKEQFVYRLNNQFEQSEKFGFIVDKKNQVGLITAINPALAWLICLIWQDHLGLARNG